MRNPLTNLTPVLTLTLALSLSTGAFAIPAPTPAVPAAVPAAAPTFKTGTVVETMDSGGYTYLQIENNGQKRWVAIPKATIKVGQQVKIALGVEMGQYFSKSLNRTFDSIYFTRGLAGNPGELPHAIPAPPPISMPAEKMSPPEKTGKPLPPAATIAGKVAETFDAGGYTYVAVEKDGVRSWVAAPPIKIVLGQEVVFKSGFVMRNFTSGSLGRSFDSIVFTSGLATSVAPVSGK